MTQTIQTSQQVLERHALEIRCGLLDLAAALDRIGRSDGSKQLAHDPRLEKIQKALAILASSENDRAERIQLLYSDEYLSGWNKSRK